jgi:hypothetical protein
MRRPSVRSAKILSRATAEALDLIRYFDGTACRNGHVAERYTKSGQCTKCIAEGHERWAVGSRAAASDYRREREIAQRPVEPERSEKRAHNVRTPNAARPKDPRLATKKADPSTPRILDMWVAGIPVEVIVAETGISANAVRIRAGNHKAKRPAWYLSAVRGKATEAHRGA